MSYAQLLSILKGGAGSGNFHHQGIPGHVGGSAPQGGGGTSFLDHNALQKLDLHQVGPDWGEQTNWKNQSYGGVIFDNEGRVLLRKPANNFGGYAWTFPKGRMDDATEHPVVTALREVEQETGHTGKIIGLLPGQYQAGYGSTKNNFFLMESSGFDPTKMDWETEKLTWATPNDAKKLIKEGSNKAGVERDLKILTQASKSYNELHTKLKGGVSFQQIITILKGGITSGNFGHDGRPGKLGGSQPGGGHWTIGARTGDDPDIVQQLVRGHRSGRGYTDYSYGNKKDLERYYNMQHNCGAKYDCDAIADYTAAGYRRINQYLRGTLPSHIDPLMQIKMIEQIDQVMDAAPRVPRAMKVYRGISPSIVHDLQPGDVFRDDGFVSTSINPNQAFSGAQLEIHVPKGSKGLYVDEISKTAGEDELMLDRSSKFKVLTAVRRRQPDGLVIVEKMVLELIND